MHDESQLCAIRNWLRGNKALQTWIFLQWPLIPTNIILEHNLVMLVRTKRNRDIEKQFYELHLTCDERLLDNETSKHVSGRNLR